MSESELKKDLESEMANYLNILNSIDIIDYDTYSNIFDFSMDLLDRMYIIGKLERNS